VKRVQRPTVATIVFGALVVLGFVLLATVLLPVGSSWQVWGAEGLYYNYLVELF